MKPTHRTLKPHEVEALHRDNWRGWATLLLGIALLLGVLLTACEGSDPPGDRALPFNVHELATDDVPIGVERGADFWSLRADVVRQRTGSITISFDEPPPDAHPCAAGWASHKVPCRPTIGMADGWGNAYQVVAHEVGHVAGLQHVDDERNIMHERIRPYSVETTLEQETAVWLLTYLLEGCRQ